MEGSLAAYFFVGHLADTKIPMIARSVRNNVHDQEDMTMATLNATEARANLYKLIDDAAANHEPVIITGKRGNAVLLAEDDWNAINETLYLLSVPGMRESIIDGMQETLDDCANQLDW